ncbi:MAG: AtpZ/AtpI family protein [Elusimicrobiota bacterium]|jgi:F0F1-type ATP synthase assembly protein I|nr:AtpZ/AtpI family protein [Elusimicrobiota bacterium]
MLKKNDHYIIAGLGVEFALVMCAGFFGGQWLDKRYNTSPWLLILCCCAAFALALYLVVRSARSAAGR